MHNACAKVEFAAPVTDRTAIVHRYGMVRDATRSSTGEPPLSLLSPVTLEDRKMFVARWMRAPLEVASVTPSGVELCRSMARVAGAAPGRRIVELGPGTGPITTALLAAGVHAEDLLLIERDPAFAARLESGFPRVPVAGADARQIARVAREHGFAGCHAVVSGLPLVAMPVAFQMRIAAGAFAVLAPDGVFVQFTYGPFAPLHPALARRLHLIGKRRAWIARNLPPASVWVYRRV